MIAICCAGVIARGIMEKVLMCPQPVGNNLRSAVDRSGISVGGVLSLSVTPFTVACRRVGPCTDTIL